MNSSKVLPNTDTIRYRYQREIIFHSFFLCMYIVVTIYIYTGKPSNVVDYLINQLTTTITQI